MSRGKARQSRTGNQDRLTNCEFLAASIKLPNLTDFTRIYINSDLDFDCDALWKDLEQTSGPLNESSKEEYFQCSVGVSWQPGGSQAATAVAALGLGFVMGLLI
jgi:hypothetical protein